MDFGDAIRAMKAGKKVARAGWNGKGMWVAYTPGSTFAKEYAKEGHAATDMIREMHRGFAMIHDALADPTRPRQSCGEVAAWWLRYAEKCMDHLRADPAAGAKAREANNG